MHQVFEGVGAFRDFIHRRTRACSTDMGIRTTGRPAARHAGHLLVMQPGA